MTMNGPYRMGRPKHMPALPRAPLRSALGWLNRPFRAEKAKGRGPLARAANTKSHRDMLLRPRRLIHEGTTHNGALPGPCPVAWLVRQLLDRGRRPEAQTHSPRTDADGGPERRRNPDRR